MPIERDAQDPRQRHRDDLPGAADQPEPGVHASATRSPSRSSSTRRSSSKEAWDRAIESLRLVGIPTPGAPGQAVPPRDVGRHAPARDDRDGPLVRARSCSSPTSRRPRSTSRSRPRSSSCSSDPGADRLGAAADHPRPRRRRRDGRPRRRHVRRPGRGAGHGRRGPARAEAPRTRWACSSRSRRSRSAAAGCRRSRARCRTRSTCRRPAGSSRAARTLGALPREAARAVQGGGPGQLARCLTAHAGRGRAPAGPGRTELRRTSRHRRLSDRSQRRPSGRRDDAAVDATRRAAAQPEPASTAEAAASRRSAAGVAARAARPAEPTGRRATPDAPEPPRGPRPLLEVTGLKKHFPIVGGILRRQIGTSTRSTASTSTSSAGEIFSLVGESGCGKTTLGRTILRLHRADRRQGRSSTARTSPTMTDNELRPLRRRMQIIFQDPFGSLNPRMPVSDIIGEGLLAQGVKDRQGSATSRSRTPRGRRPAARLHPPLPARVLRRPAPADRHRPGARARAGVHRLRRAGLGARRVDPEPDPEPAARPAPRLQPDLPVHQPQPVGRPVLQRPGRGHVPRQDRRAGDGRAALPQPAPPVHGRAAVGDPGRRTRVAARSASSSRATCPSPAAPPSGCRFHTRCWLREQLGNPERCVTEDPPLRDRRRRPHGRLPLRRGDQQRDGGRGGRSGSPRSRRRSPIRRDRPAGATPAGQQPTMTHPARTIRRARRADRIAGRQPRRWRWRRRRLLRHEPGQRRAVDVAEPGTVRRRRPGRALVRRGRLRRSASVGDAVAARRDRSRSPRSAAGDGEIAQGRRRPLGGGGRNEDLVRMRARRDRAREPRSTGCRSSVVGLAELSADGRSRRPSTGRRFGADARRVPAALGHGRSTPATRTGSLGRDPADHRPG